MPAFRVVVPPVFLPAELGELFLGRVFFFGTLKIFICNRICYETLGPMFNKHLFFVSVYFGVSHGNLLGTTATFRVVTKSPVTYLNRILCLFLTIFALLAPMEIGGLPLHLLQKHSQNRPDHYRRCLPEINATVCLLN